MNIVILDGLTRFTDYVDWSPLSEFGTLTVHDSSTPNETVQRAVDAEVILVNGTVITREIIEQLPRLRYIGITITGHDLVDVAAATRRGVVVTNVPTYATRSVAQMAFAHVLNLTQRIPGLCQSVRCGEYWGSIEDLFNGNPLLELDGLAMGIVGFGRIGRAVAELAQAFGMKILAFDTCRTEVLPGVDPPDVDFVELDALFRQSDVISLHCPITEENRGLVDRRRLKLMKPSAFLINTSRGQLIDEEALAEALNSCRIAGAGLDVLSAEPPPADHPLLTAKNCFVTPHVGAATRAAWHRQFQIVVENLKAFLQGNPQNVVVPEV